MLYKSVKSYKYELERRRDQDTMSILAPVNVRLQAVGRDAIDVSHCPHHCFCNVAAVGERTCLVASSRSQLDICFAQSKLHTSLSISGVSGRPP